LIENSTTTVTDAEVVYRMLLGEKMLHFSHFFHHHLHFLYVHHERMITTYYRSRI